MEGVSTAHMLAVEISLSSCSMHGVLAEQTGPSDVSVIGVSGLGMLLVLRD